MRRNNYFIVAKDERGTELAFKHITALKEYLIAVGKGRAEPLEPKSIRRETDWALLDAIRAAGNLYGTKGKEV
jgi:hypothetical protein